MKITTIYIAMIPMMMIINNSYFIFNLIWTTLGGTAMISCKTPTNLISSVSLPQLVSFKQYCVSVNVTSKLESNIHLPKTTIQ